MLMGASMSFTINEYDHPAVLKVFVRQTLSKGAIREDSMEAVNSHLSGRLFHA